MPVKGHPTMPGKEGAPEPGHFEVAMESDEKVEVATKANEEMAPFDMIMVDIVVNCD